MIHRLAAVAAAALLLAACASQQQKPATDATHPRYQRLTTAAPPAYQHPTGTDPHARVKLVASESLLTGSAYISAAGCSYPPARTMGNNAETVSVFGPNAPSGLPFSPGESLGMPGARFKPGFTTEKRLRPGVPVTLGFQGTVGQGHGRYTTDPTRKSGYQVGPHVTVCSVAMTFTPQAGEDYMFALIIGVGLEPHCVVVPERYDTTTQRWTPLTAVHQPRRAPLCSAAE